MGFNIGRFLGSIAPAVGTAVGGFFGGAPGAAAGAALGVGVQSGFTSDGTAQAATVGRVTQPGPVSVAPTPRTAQFAGGGFFPTSTAPAPFLGGLARSLGRGGTALQLFGNGNGNGQGQIAEILSRARAATGGPVTRNKIIDAAKVCGLETAASTFGVSVNDVCLVVIKGRTRRRRGVSAADIRRTKRTINFASKVRKDLKALAR